MNRQEQSLQTALCTYMKHQYQSVIFKCDHGANSNKPSQIERQIYCKQQYKRGYPDFQIIKPTNHYAGLFLELKGSYSDLFNKNGTMKPNDGHHAEQYNFIKELRNNGYYADFCYSFDVAKNIIDMFIDDNTEIKMFDYTFNSLSRIDLSKKTADNFLDKYDRGEFD